MVGFPTCTLHQQNPPLHVGRDSSTLPLSPSFWPIFTQRDDSLFILHAQDSSWFFLHATNWRGDLRTRTLCAYSPYRFVFCVHVFPCPGMRIRISLPFWDCVMFPSLHCEMGLLFFPWFVVAIVFPTLFVAVEPITFWPCCRLLWVALATIGPRTTQGSIFSPVQAVNSLFAACMQWLVFRLFLEWGWGISLLHNPSVFGNHTDRARGLAFFFTTPE